MGTYGYTYANDRSNEGMFSLIDMPDSLINWNFSTTFLDDENKNFISRYYYRGTQVY